MEGVIAEAREVAIPSSTFAELRRKIRDGAGPLVAVHALQSAGYEAGSTLFDAFSRHAEGDPADLGQAHFFERLGRFLGQRGWGALHHRTPHPAIGLLSSTDWAEAGEADDEPEPACAYSSGMLSALLTRTAGGPVAVLQVACRARGDDRCAFAFGSESTVHTLYELLLEDVELDAALARL